MEGHGVSGVVTEDRPRAFHGDSSRLVGIAPTSGGIAVAVVQRLVGGEECVPHPCLGDATVREKSERDTRDGGGCLAGRDVALRRCRRRASTQHRQSGGRGRDAQNVSSWHAPSIAEDNCAVKNLGSRQADCSRARRRRSGETGPRPGGCEGVNFGIGGLPPEAGSLPAQASDHRY